MGYLDWRTGGLSGSVDEDFESINEDLPCILHLSVSESLILLSSDQHITSEISIDPELRKLWLNRRIVIKGRSTRWLNCLVDII